MPIRFFTNGTVEVDSLNEALSWQSRKTKSSKPVGRPRKVKPDPIDGSPWERFCNDIRAIDCTRLRKILAIIKGRGQVGIELHELSRAVGDSKFLKTSGTISGVRLKAEKFGLNVDDLIVRGDDKLFRPGKILQENDPPVP